MQQQQEESVKTSTSPRAYDNNRETSSKQEAINRNIVNYASVVKRNTPNNAEITKRKATSLPDYSPSTKLQKQETIVSDDSTDMPSKPRVDHQEKLFLLLPSTAAINGNINMEFKTRAAEIEGRGDVPKELASESDTGMNQESSPCPRLSSRADIQGVPEHNGNFGAQHGDVDASNDDNDNGSGGAVKRTTNNSSIITPYAEIVRRNAASKHPSFLGSGALTRMRSKILAAYDRLDQQLVKPAPIPWFETGDPLMQLYRKERKQANEYGYKMNKYFKLSQRCYHEKDWENAKYYSDEGHYYRQRMHEFHTRASHRIFQQRNQQDALFIDLHGMHVDEAKASIVSWFQNELKDHRGIVYIVTGTGHHSRSAATCGSTSNNKESRLRPAAQNFLNNLYRCEETSVLGDDKGGVFAVYLCPHLYLPNMPLCVYCKFSPTAADGVILE
ncbi:hypothetical protein BDB00DRAFT_824673 [Zychaea mexicana]|uniref:uncharacterized protein n=1 Tax=Zychaea mexicana TaxID=64656 RepID=UPI0022FDC0E5|nr:uncharacterized protein BDB00DRAFT_824673 [Zychaea mexicana]KAI9493170.1 hypothetical protein BDB00DRAFT_824673 [Zychaea mexicana]